MIRKRLQDPDPYIDGNWWRVRWWQDVIGPDGQLTRKRHSAVVGPATGPERLGKKEAKEKCRTDILTHVNAATKSPASIMSLRQFYVQKFEPDIVGPIDQPWGLKYAGKKHYAYCMKHILPALGDMALREINREVLQAFLRRAMIAPSRYTKRPLSIQTAYHLKNAVSGIITYAKEIGYYHGENPASLVRLPELTNKKKPSLSAEQGRAVLSMMSEPYRTAALMSMTTSLNNSEIQGLTNKYVNLSDKVKVVAHDKFGDLIFGPWTFGVFENVYRHRRGTVKTGNRNRIQPIPRALVEPLQALYAASKWQGPDDPVFYCTTGAPVTLGNYIQEQLKVIGKAIGVPTLSWQSFRRTAATLTGLTSMPKADRIAMMGHGADGAMTDRYSDGDVERRRGYLDQIADELVPAKDIDELEKIWRKA
jgi:integrase